MLPTTANRRNVQLASIGGYIDPNQTAPAPGNEIRNTGTATDVSCPCRIDRRQRTKYLVDAPQPGSQPVMVEETGWVCDEPSTKRTRILCEETNAANQQQMNDCPGIAYSLGEAQLPLLSYGGTGTVTVGTAPPESKKETPWLTYGAIAAVAVAGTYFATQTKKRK